MSEVVRACVQRALLGGSRTVTHSVLRGPNPPCKSHCPTLVIPPLDPENLATPSYIPSPPLDRENSMTPPP